jgi:hypothetical protein
MTEQELIDQLSQAEDDLKQAKRVLSEAKKRLVDVEDQVITCKLYRDRAKESLREYRNTNYIPEIEQRDEEIEKFRQDNPEVCRLARDRDLNRP